MRGKKYFTEEVRSISEANEFIVYERLGNCHLADFQT